MKHIKLFEQMIEPSEFPIHGHDLSIREKSILEDFYGYLRNNFIIKVDDHKYYTKYNPDFSYLCGNFYNTFENFSELKDYISSHYFMYYGKAEEYLELLKTSKLDPSFDENCSIGWASKFDHIEILKHLLDDPRVDPSYNNNWTIRMASFYGRSEIVKILLNDERVRSKLTDFQIYNYTNEIS